MDETKTSLIPVFIEASSKKELMAKMLNTNLINAKAYNFQTPVKEGSKWVVWYYADVENHKHVDIDAKKEAFK